jgi:hypothetical protein
LVILVCLAIDWSRHQDVASVQAFSQIDASAPLIALGLYVICFSFFSPVIAEAAAQVVFPEVVGVVNSVFRGSP